MVWNDVVWKGCSPSNYTPGRQGTTIRYITMHHVVGSMESVASAWANPARGGSSHFTVGERGAWQFVDTEDTAWCNTNWASNLESISIEHEGDWRFGYRNEGCINQSAELIALLRRTHPSIVGFQRHNQVAQTACPCDLPCEEIWNKSTAILNPAPVTPPPAVPPAVAIQITDVQNRVVITNKDANLWDLNFTSWATAKSVKVIPKGTEVEISATAKHPLGGTYYLSEYSFSKGIKNGLNVADCSDKVAPPPVTPPPVTPPVTPPVIPPVTPPVVPPKPTKDEEQDKRLTALETAVKALQDILTKVLEFFKGLGGK